MGKWSAFKFSNGRNPMTSINSTHLITHLILVAFSLGFNNTAAAGNDAATARYQHAIQANQSCESCHEKNQVNIYNASMSNDCLECHASDEDGPVVSVAETETLVAGHPQEEKRFADPYADKLKVAPPPEVTAGMSVPILYNETRIGKEPNEMIPIPAGEFTRGSNHRLPDEGPEYIAKTKSFLIDKYEVTNLQYKQFINDTNRKSPNHFRSRTYPEGKVDHPVVFVSWYDAHDYCKWAGKRLPTDIEWEKAARGTDGRDYPWGDDFDVNKVNSPVRWSSLKMKGDTLPTGSFEAGKSPYGLYDMSGNVWEWTDSWYTQYPGNQWPSENYGELYKVLKGGSWWDCSFYQCGVSAPVFNRSYFKQNIKNSSFGFRCAKDDK
ncbi:MAG: SUMF1/EgtB/PvdO family nonheme iron enzyme [Gallionella sp.]